MRMLDTVNEALQLINTSVLYTLKTTNLFRMLACLNSLHKITDTAVGESTSNLSYNAYKRPEHSPFSHAALFYSL